MLISCLALSQCMYTYVYENTVFYLINTYSVILQFEKSNFKEVTHAYKCTYVHTHL